MRFVFLIVVVFSLAGCHNYIPTSQLKTEALSIRDSLIENESSVSGDFFRTREFHLGLMAETTNPDAEAYRDLDAVFKRMRNYADAVIIQRMTFDKHYYFIDSLSQKHSRIKTTSEEGILVRKKIDEGNSMHEMSSNVRVECYEKLSEVYWSTVDVYKIKRMEQSEYAASVNERLIQWQDSLEQVGRLIGAEKADLKVRYPEQKGEAFFTHYKYVSELESLLKVFDSSLMQLQNSLSRIEGGNQEEFYYFGPYLPERREYQATEGIIGQLALYMQDCRAKSAEYWSSYAD